MAVRTSRRIGERGQTLLEFALLSPLILLFLFAIVWFGLAMHTRSNLQQAVREGARQAAVGKPLSEVQSLGAGNSGGTLQSDDLAWCLPSGSSGKVGDQIRVYVDDGGNGTEGYDFELTPNTGLFAFFGAGGITVTMSPRATARLEKTLTGVPACTS